MSALSPLKVLILGGIKSGKTRYALKLINELKGVKKIYVATSEPLDEETKRKIEKHKKERDSSWTTIETPLEIFSVIEEYQNKNHHALLIDCFTMWINNMMYYGWSESQIFNAFDRTLRLINRARCHIVGVSNEVGLGIIPETMVSRKYINYLGEFNQMCAKTFPKVLFIISGLPLVLKEP